MFTPITTVADFGSTLARARKGLGLTQLELCPDPAVARLLLADLGYSSRAEWVQ